MFNTWALKDRALFSINGEVLFTKDVNFTLKAYQYSLCLIGKNNIIDAISGLDRHINFIKISSTPYDSEERKVILRAFELSRAIAIESESLEMPKLGKCNIPSIYQKRVIEIYNANAELLKKHKDFISKNKDKGIEDYKALVFKPIQSRLFL